MDQEVERRIAANQARFRQVNEAIARGQWPGEGADAVGFRCECALLGCNRLIELTPPEYERVRTHPRRFVVLPGHERDTVETVIEKRSDYFVVEKTDEAGQLADATDPRG
ncbi:MAG TPA: hypothetical protein VIJ20_07695 [Solirubrobacteraceae bacterium]